MSLQDSKKSIWIFILVAAFFLLARVTLGSVTSNLGMVVFSRSIFGDNIQFAGGVYPVLALKPLSANFQMANYWLQLSNQIQASPITGWKLVRLGLISGDQDLALSGVQQMRGHFTDMPLAYEDVVFALSKAQQYQEITNSYELFQPELRTMVLSDTIALAYLEQAQPHIDARDLSAAYPWLTKAIQFRPFDLYANAMLYQQATESEDIAAATRYRSALEVLSGAAVHPTDAHLAKFIARALPIIEKYRIWNKDTVNHVLASIGWLYSDSADVQNLLVQKASQEVNNPEMRFILGDMYQRQGKLEQAATEYQEVSTMTPTIADAYLRLGVLCNGRIKTCSAAQSLEWYSKYITLRPNDLRALREATEICGHYRNQLSFTGLCKSIEEVFLQSSSFAAVPPIDLAHEIDSDAYDLAAISSALKVSTGMIHLGENLLGDGEVSVPWKANDEMNIGAKFRKNAFIEGLDTVNTWRESGSIRLLGLGSGERMSEVAPEWYGVWSWNDIQGKTRTIEGNPSQWYFINLYYRTAGADGTAGLHLNQDMLFTLPSTKDEWHRFGSLVCTPPGSMMLPMAPFIYLTNMNDQVWFSDFSVRPVEASVATRPCTESPILVP